MRVLQAFRMKELVLGSPVFSFRSLRIQQLASKSRDGNRGFVVRVSCLDARNRTQTLQTFCSLWFSTGFEILRFWIKISRPSNFGHPLLLRLALFTLTDRASPAESLQDSRDTCWSAFRLLKWPADSIVKVLCGPWFSTTMMPAMEWQGIEQQIGFCYRLTWCLTLLTGRSSTFLYLLITPHCQMVGRQSCTKTYLLGLHTCSGTKWVSCVNYC